MLADSGDGPVDRQLQACFVVEVLDDLLDEVGVEDHGDDAAGEGAVDGEHTGVEVFTKELLLRLDWTQLGHLLDRDFTLGCQGHRHGLRRGHGLAAVAESGEGRLVNGDRGLFSGDERARVGVAAGVSAALLLLVCLLHKPRLSYN